MGMCREKRIHLLRQFSILLPPFSPKQGQPHVPLGQHTGFAPAWARQNTSISSITPALPALLCRAGGENKFLQDFVQVGLEMMAPVPLPSWNWHSSTPLPGTHLTEPSVHSDKVATNFKATFILYATALQICIPGFMKQRQRKMGWQSAEICRHTLWFTAGNRGVHWLSHYFLPALTFFISKRTFLHRRNQFFPQNNIVMPILWTTLIKRERKQMRERGREFKILPKYVVSDQIFYLARDHFLSFTSLKESQRQGKEVNFPNDYKFWEAKTKRREKKEMI